MAPGPGIRCATYLIALILAAILFIWGVVTLVRGRVLLGIVLIVFPSSSAPGDTASSGRRRAAGRAGTMRHGPALF